MSGEDLLKALEETGTGESKLTAARLALREKKGMPAEELVAVMAEPDGKGRALWPEGTVEKARKLMAGADPRSDAMQGTPPPQSKEASEERLAKAIGEQMSKVMAELHGKKDEKQAQAQAQNIGRPIKPTDKDR